MKRKLLFLLILSAWIEIVKAEQPVNKIWNKDIKLTLNSINKAVAFQVDNMGNCYVLGTSWYIDSTKNILLVKVDSVGRELWVRTYDNPMHGDDIPTSLCLDLAGNVWVCGMSRTSKSNVDLVTIKFNADGVPVFDYIYDGNDHLFDCGNTLAADKQGNVYVGGYETSVDSGINMLVMKFKPDGTVAWKRNYSTMEMDIANQLITDDSSNVYICGTVNSGLHSADIIVLKYDQTGRKKWQYNYSGALMQSDFGKYITADDSMNIYVSGFINHSNDRADIPILKFNRNGKMIQENLFNGKISDCGALSLSATKNSVYVTGGCYDYNVATNSTFLYCLDKAGREVYTLMSPDDVRFIDHAEIYGKSFNFGSKLVHPESTLIPFIAENDSTGLTWTFADSTVTGIAHLISCRVKKNDVYFLGDDCSDATGTISIFKYSLAVKPVEVKKETKKKK